MSHIADTTIPPRQIHLNTKHASQRLTGNSSDVIWFLTNTINVPTNVEMLLSVETVQIPHGIHTFNKRNNTFKYSCGDRTYTEVIENGNYSHENFTAGEVKNSATGEVLGLNHFTISLIEHQNKFKLTSADSNPITIDSAWELLGFTPGQTGATITASNCFDLNGLSSLLLTSNFATANIDSVHTGLNSSILGRVPINCAPGGTIFYQKQNEYQIVLQAHNIHRVHLRLIDDDREIIDLNGLDWHITLNLNFRYAPKMIIASSLDDLHDQMEAQRVLTLRDLNNEIAKKTSKKKK